MLRFVRPLLNMFGTAWACVRALHRPLISFESLADKTDGMKAMMSAREEDMNMQRREGTDTLIAVLPHMNEDEERNKADKAVGRREVSPTRYPPYTTSGVKHGQRADLSATRMT